jgi:hypothetical protein
VIATITDASSVPTTGLGLPVLYWQINTTGIWNATAATFIGNDQFSFTIGNGTVTGDSVLYYVVAHDIAATPNIGSNPLLGAAGFSINPPSATTPPTTLNQYKQLASMSGIYTIDNTLPTGGSNFNNFTDAVNVLNAAGLTGPIVFNVIADQSWAMTCPASPDNYAIKIANLTASETNTITFQKFGTGENPVLNITGTSSSSDKGIWINGSDYVTFDGIDIMDAGTALDQGFYLNGSATDGCNFNTIKNCNIKLSNTRANSNPT